MIQNRLLRAMGVAALIALNSPTALADARAPSGQCISNKPPPVSFGADIQSLLNQRCVMCHLTGAENAALNLEPGLAYKNLVGARSSQSAMLRVKPGAPEESYLVRKLIGGYIEAGGAGAQMPIDGPPLDADTTALITSWIKACAPDN